MFGQLPEVKQYLKRVRDSGGTIRNDVQVAINNFSKKMYKLGLRSTNSNTHKIQHCCIYPTEDKTGSEYNLWFLDNKITHYKQTFDALYSYTLEQGLYAENDVNLDTDVNCNLLNTSDLSLGFYVPVARENRGEYGGISDNTTAEPIGKRMFVHLQYTDTRGIYFDVGNKDENRRVSGTISSVPGDKDNRGLTICTKLGSTGKIQHKNSRVATKLDMTANSSRPSGYMEFHPGIDSTDKFNLSGYWFGSDIPENTFTELTNAWNDLQKTIHPERAFDYTPPAPPLPAPKLWFDASDTSTITISGGYVSAWNNKSGSSNNLTVANPSFTVEYDTGKKAMRFYNVDNGGYFVGDGGLYFGTIAFVIEPARTLSYTTSRANHKYLLGYDSFDDFKGLIFGDSTSWLNNEVVGMLTGGRFALESTSFSFQSGQKYSVIMSRDDSGFGGVLLVNGVEYPVADASGGGAGNPSTYLTNENFTLGSSFGNTNDISDKFRGYLYDFRSYSEALTLAQCQILAQELN